MARNNLNIHFHMLFLDGVYVDNWQGAWFRWVEGTEKRYAVSFWFLDYREFSHDSTIIRPLYRIHAGGPNSFGQVRMYSH